ncbi:unnamed protein product [Linum tenue]|uniref:Uncharacterized protein n=1 Tax=Linum tenue TaxID=586396 RepID=A0AAV0NNJ3_9ROSI|nr:unnamed protein product [Linum tenue]
MAGSMVLIWRWNGGEMAVTLLPLPMEVLADVGTIADRGTARGCRWEVGCKMVKRLSATNGRRTQEE